MTKAQHPTLHLAGLALNAAGGVPDWIQLTPAGPDVVGRDGRSWRLSDPAAVVARTAAEAQPIVVDIDHASETRPAGEPAPAQGWIEAVEVRDGALWGRVSWTVAGRALMAAEAYRYVSPTFLFDKTTREIVRLTSAALVHRPNLQLQALNSQDDETEETVQMDKAICEALGLAANATPADAVVAITALKAEQETALNAAAHPDPERFVPRADHDLALNRITAFEADEKARQETAINAAVDAAVDAAVAAGKIAPASKEYHVATCKAVGLEKFQAMVGTMPAIAAPGKPGAKPAAGAAMLTDEQAWACNQLGIDPDVYAKSLSTEA